MELERIGPYVIERQIGAGGMGNVYLARHTETGRRVAVKVLSPALSREEGFVERFRREIDALKRLKNPHVVELYDSGVDGELYYYAMEYVEGETLNQRLRRQRRMPWQEVVEVAIQVCSALKAAHDAGIIHRDLKPSNLILTADGIVKLTDFGIAQLFATSKLTTTGSIVGTPEYISPEQAEGKRATKRSDLYSLGVLIYTMLTGRPPFLGKTTLDVIQKHRYGRFDRLSALVPDVPRRLEQIVDQLLEKDPEKRFPDAYVLSLRLKEVLKRAEREEKATVTHERDLGYDYDGEAPTVAVGKTKGAQGPGPATVMHNLMKAELDRTQQPTPLGRIFNSGWFLLACFVLLVVGGVWWFRTQPLARVVQEPMEEEPAPGEIDRLLELARHQQRLGDEARAERILSSLCTLLADDPKHERQYKLAQRRLEQLRSRRAERAERDELLKGSLDRAAELVEQGQPQKAAAICRSLLELYRDDPTAADAVQKAEQLLQQIETSSSPETERSAE